MADMMPARLPPIANAVKPGFHAAQGEEIMHVALVTGCVQSVLGPHIDAAAIRVLTRHGCSVTVPKPSAAGCCGALPHHLGKSKQARKMARRNLDAWRCLRPDPHTARPLDAVVMTASGCTSMLRDYPHVLLGEVDYQKIDINFFELSQILNELFTINPPLVTNPDLPKTLAWQAPCSLQHGMQEKSAPITILRACGFEVLQPRDAHLCCGSAGTYNLLQSEFAMQLGKDKGAKLRATGAPLVVSANIGCITQLGSPHLCDSPLPVIHLAEVLDWATGGPKPDALR